MIFYSTLYPHATSPYRRTALFGFNCFLNTKNQIINTPLFRLKTQPYTLVKHIGVGLTTSYMPLKKGNETN